MKRKATSKATSACSPTTPPSTEGLLVEGRPKHPEDSFHWMWSYPKRALLTRLSVETTRNKFNESALPTKVKLFTRHPDPDGEGPVRCTSFCEDATNQLADLTETQFKAAVKEACGDAFNTELSLDSDPDWDKAFGIIEAQDYTFSKQGTWATTKPVLPPGGNDGIHNDLYIMAQSLERALVTMMSNGEAKKFIEKMLNSIQIHEGITDSVVTHESPVNYSYTNGRVQFVEPDDVDTWENDEVSVVSVQRRRTSAAWSSIDSEDPSVCPSEIHGIVPDHIWYLHHYPGFFILNVECKQVADYSSRIQCIHQMLTQMHFQNSSFGLLISKKGWHLILIRKHDDIFSVYQMSSSLISLENLHFNVQSLKSLCCWLYRIMNFRLKCFAG
ncbi:uncharacterized protein LOC135497979 isoform X1 [Lineus longissimus]|uniref:uncharacterized protein LOC135497979 isoform X1 n=2 Tax=Lineus longissimus TaxID=88925 RepID=UPI002B4E08AA